MMGFPRILLHIMRADLWQRGCERLAAELPDQQFQHLDPASSRGEVADLGDAGAMVTIRVPNRFKLDWIRTQYAGRIESALSDLAGKPVVSTSRLATRDACVPGRAALCRAIGAARRCFAAGPERPQCAGRLGCAPALAQPPNPALSFDTLVPGRANQMARTAALHVRRGAGADVQPALHLRRRRPRQDAPDSPRRQRASRRPPDARILYLQPSSSSPTW